MERVAALDLLRVTAALSICTYFLPDVMKDYQAANSKVMVSLRSGNSAEVLKMVLDGEADIGVARSLNHPEVETMTLRDDPLILVGHPGHPAARKRAETPHVGAAVMGRAAAAIYLACAAIASIPAGLLWPPRRP